MMVLLIVLICTMLIQVSCHLDHFTYNGFVGTNTNLSLTEAAQFSRGNATVQLTSLETTTGHVFHSTPFEFKNSTNNTVSSFSTCFAFLVLSSRSDSALGSGTTLSFAVEPSTDFSSATWKRPSSNRVLGVVFDIYKRYGSRDLNDNHVRIDVSVLSTRQNYLFSGTYVNPTLRSGQPIVAWIEYDSVTSLLSFTISPSSKRPSVHQFSAEIDLSPIMFGTMYVGLSASTGLVSSFHYLLGWSFQMYGGATLDLDVLPSISRTKNKQARLITIVSTSVFTCLIILASVFTAIYVLRRKVKVEVIESWELEVGPCRYNYSDLQQATNNFSDTELLGRGGFGRVYGGTLPNTEMKVAVKHISHESKQGVGEFVAEIITIGKLGHRNLVQLLGWCRRGADLLLVYDLMPNGSLDKFLFKQREGASMSWEQRFRIIKGVASGLLYLHEGYEKVVIHRDVKASNVLLDGEMNAKLGDFGLARLHDHGSHPDTTRVVGTLGYMAPELMRSGRATASSDVFAFGILLLEVACGRKPIEHTSRPEDLILVELVRRKHQEERILDVVDEKMESKFDENEVLMVLKLGLMCSSKEQSDRPGMMQVVSCLEGDVGMPMVLRPQAAFGKEDDPEGYVHRSASFTALPDSLVCSMYEPR